MSERVSDEAVAENTGRTLQEWFKVLDRWGAMERDHKATAAYLVTERGVDNWWAQTVTVAYEQARGLRALGQQRGGLYEASVQRTVAADAATVERVFRDGAWLPPDDAAPVRAAIAAARWSDTNQGRVSRSAYTPAWADAEHALQIVFTPKGDKTAVIVTHGKLPNAKARDTAKAAWAKLLDALKAHAAP